MKLLIRLHFTLCVFLIFGLETQAQFKISGQIPDADPGTNIYLSLVEDYRKINRVYVDQIIRRTTTDSLGYFTFTGDNLYEDNRIYRLHLDSCSEPSGSNHFLGICEDVRSVIFIANNTDTLSFPSGFDNEVFCSVQSSNSKSGVFLEFDQIREEMILDFAQFNSEANRQLNLEKWFSKWQKLGEMQDEPLAELYIYQLLSDKGSPAFSHYLQEVTSNPYYDQLLNRLLDRYPHTTFTELYRTELTADRQLASLRNPSESRKELTIYLLLAISVLLNLLLFIRWRRSKYKKNNSLQKLTRQERKIVDHIISGMSNKEIADELFVSVSTVKTHINNLYKKLDISDRNDIKSLFGS